MYPLTGSAVAGGQGLLGGLTLGGFLATAGLALIIAAAIGVTIYGGYLLAKNVKKKFETKSGVNKKTGPAKKSENPRSKKFKGRNKHTDGRPAPNRGRGGGGSW